MKLMLDKGKLLGLRKIRIINNFHIICLLSKTNEVINMCSSSNFIEQQAYEMSEKIRKASLYKFIRVNYSGGNHLESHSEVPLITQVILADKNGTTYSVEPNPIGLRFAKGEITYKEYKKLQKRNSLNGIAVFTGIVVFFIGFMFVLMKYFA